MEAVTVSSYSPVGVGLIDDEPLPLEPEPVDPEPDEPELDDVEELELAELVVLPLAPQPNPTQATTDTKQRRTIPIGRREARSSGNAHRLANNAAGARQSDEEAGAVVVTITETVTEAAIEKLTVAGWIEQVLLAGTPTQENWIVPVKPGDAETVRG